MFVSTKRFEELEKNVEEMFEILLLLTKRDLERCREKAEEESVKSIINNVKKTNRK